MCGDAPPEILRINLFTADWAANRELMITKKRLKIKRNYIYTITTLTTGQKYIKISLYTR